MKFGTLFIALLLAGSTAQAQIPTPTPEAGPWSLDDCIRYAHEHNIQIQQQALQVEQRSVELNTSRHSRLPDLGANLGTNFSFGRSLISNNTYAYFRYDDTDAVFVFINNSRGKKQVPWSHYAEIAEGLHDGRNVLTGEAATVNDNTVVGARQALVVEFKRPSNR